MDELSNRLSEVLQNPEKIEQIMEMASSLGISPQSFPKNHTDEPVSAEQQQETLFRALMPYLKPTRQQRLERAMQLCHLSKIAENAMRHVQFSSGDSGEEETLV